MTKGKKAAIGISAAVLTAGLGLGAVGFANAETPSPTTPPSSSAPGQQDSGRSGQGGWGRHGQHGESSKDLTALAEKLGVDSTKLEAALKSAREATRTTKGDTSPSDLTASEREARRTEREAALVKALASELGIEQSKVEAAFKEVRAEHEATRQADDKAVLDQAVKDGKLTQAEADAVQKAADQGIVRIGHGR